MRRRWRATRKSSDMLGHLRGAGSAGEVQMRAGSEACCGKLRSVAPLAGEHAATGPEKFHARRVRCDGEVCGVLDWLHLQCGGTRAERGVSDFTTGGRLGVWATSVMVGRKANDGGNVSSRPGPNKTFTQYHERTRCMPTAEWWSPRLALHPDQQKHDEDRKEDFGRCRQRGPPLEHQVLPAEGGDMPPPHGGGRRTRHRRCLTRS